MKKTIFLVISSVCLLSCANDSSPEKAETLVEVATKADDPIVAQGLSLVANNDCTGCHAIEVQMVGPSYKAVADRYEPTEQNITTLAEKVIQGGMGNWGQAPMSPHPQLTKQEAEAMVQYILSLKTDAK